MVETQKKHKIIKYLVVVVVYGIIWENVCQNEQRKRFDTLSNPNLEIHILTKEFVN